MACLALLPGASSAQRELAPRRGASERRWVRSRTQRHRATVQAFANLGMVPKANTPAELGALIKAEGATWGPIIRSTGFKPLE
jgi:hypothetical protein